MIKTPLPPAVGSRPAGRRGKSRPKARRAVHSTCKLVAALLAALCVQGGHAGVLGEVPDVVVCRASDPTGVLPWQQLVFYVSAELRDGSTLYKSLTSPPLLLSVDARGVVHADNLADCDGRDVSALRRAGRALDWPPGTPPL